MKRVFKRPWETLQSSFAHAQIYFSPFSGRDRHDDHQPGRRGRPDHHGLHADQLLLRNPLKALRPGEAKAKERDKPEPEPSFLGLDCAVRLNLSDVHQRGQITKHIRTRAILW